MPTTRSHRPAHPSRPSAYDIYVGRWSRLVAPLFIDWLGAPGAGRWLDVGCGTGALTLAILRHAKPAAVTGLDPARDYLAAAQADPAMRGVRFLVGSAHDLPFPDGSFDMAVIGLSLAAIPDPQRAVDELRRVLRPGGIAATYVWDFAGRMEVLRHFWDAAIALDPAAQRRDPGHQIACANPAALAALFGNGGLDAVTTEALDANCWFEDFDDYWTGFLLGEGEAARYCRELDPERRTLLRHTLRERVPAEPDGSLRLTARAWAVRGRAGAG